MGKIVKLTESQLTSIVKKVIQESQEDAELQQLTQQFNQETGENLTVQQYVDIGVCRQGVGEPDLSRIPDNQKEEAKGIFTKLINKFKTLNREQLKKALRELRQALRKAKQERKAQSTASVNEQDNIGGKIAGGVGIPTTGYALLLGVPILNSILIGLGLSLFFILVVSIIDGTTDLSKYTRAKCGPYQSNAYMKRTIRGPKSNIGKVGLKKVRYR